VRKILATAAGAALIALTAGCASTVSGHGTIDLAVAPTAGPTSGPTGTTEPTSGPTGDPTDDPTDDPTESPTGSGDDGDRQSVADVTERWYHAIGARDGDTVCGLMTAKARASAGSGGKSCEDSVESTTLSTSQRDAMTKVEVDPDGVTVSGDSARVPATAVTVSGQHSTSSQTIEVVRDGGDWLIDDIG
jgi:hypothetical protein